MNEIWVSINEWMRFEFQSMNEWDLSFNEWMRFEFQWMNEIWVSINDTTWFVCVVNISDLTCILKYISSSNIFEV